MIYKIFKPLSAVIIFLLIGLAFQPAVSTNELIKDDVTPCNNLVEILNDIIKNPKINKLLSQIDLKDVRFDNNLNSVLLNIFIKKPGLLTSVFFNRPILSNNNLASYYNKGIEITNILGKSKTLETVNYLKNSNSDNINEITKTVLNDQELKDKISNLKIDNQIKHDESFATTPLICIFFTSLTILFVIIAVVFKDISNIFPDGSQIRSILLNLISPFIEIALLFAAIAGVFGCWDDFPGA